jgi:hypothetical protein
MYTIMISAYLRAASEEVEPILTQLYLLKLSTLSNSTWSAMPCVQSSAASAATAEDWY